MNYFVLIVTSCLSNGGDCYPHAIAQDLAEMECRSRNQAIMAEWWNQHPTRIIAKYACVPERRKDFYLGRGEA